MTTLAKLERTLSPVEAIVLAVDALPALPANVDGDRYAVRRLTASWLAKLGSDHTRRAYFGDLSEALAWCDRQQLEPLAARPADYDIYKVGLVDRYAASTVGRKLSALSSWYAYLLSNQAEGVRANPLAGVDRPDVSRDDSPTVGLDPYEVAAVLTWADHEVELRQRRHDADPTPGRHARLLAALRDRALVRVLAGMGLRVGSVLAMDVSALSYRQGLRTLRYVGKGKRRRERPLNPTAAHALDDYLRARAAAAGVDVDELTGPLFATTGRGGAVGRVDEPTVFRLIRRLGRYAGLPHAARLSPHSLRHAFATNALDDGAELRDVQDAMDHADPRTTRRYDRNRRSLLRDPALRLDAVYAVPTSDG